MGAWYTVTPIEEGAEVVRQKDMVDKAEPKVHSFTGWAGAIRLVTLGLVFCGQRG